jgi:D-alanine-D-alanine ligase
MSNKKTVAIIFGGKSTEHEVSIRSARNIVKAIDTNLFSPILIGVDKEGAWILKTETELDTENVVESNSSRELVILPGKKTDQVLLKDNLSSVGPIDVVFPIIHGTGGEDGTIQGLLKTINLPFVGPSVLASSLCLDKEVTKRLLSHEGIKNSKFLSYLNSEKDLISFEQVQNQLGMPVYIKPPNLGSSVGISKVNSKEEFDAAIDLAFQFDRKVLIEENIAGREIECAVLGNANVKASPAGEVLTVGENHSFYSYDAKYIDADGSITVIPAEMDENEMNKVRKVAIDAYQCLCCEGMARVDVFIKDNGDIYVNEINTIPGFTDISMYPKLWGAAGLNYTNLITELINLALDRFNEEEAMQTSM